MKDQSFGALACISNIPGSIRHVRCSEGWGCTAREPLDKFAEMRCHCDVKECQYTEKSRVTLCTETDILPLHKHHALRRDCNEGSTHKTSGLQPRHVKRKRSNHAQITIGRNSTPDAFALSASQVRHANITVGCSSWTNGTPFLQHMGSVEAYSRIVCCG